MPTEETNGVRCDPAAPLGRRPLSETDVVPPTKIDARTGGSRASGTTVETGTTVVALTAGDAVVLAADRRASVGSGRFVTGKDVRKVEQVHPTAATAGSGAVSHLQHLNDTLSAEASLYETRRGEPVRVEALATLAGNVLRRQPMQVQVLLGGVDAEGPRVYTLDGAGSVLGDEYAAGGSGMQVAYGVLERGYDSGITSTDARALAARAIAAAGERDTASGNGLTLAVVTEGGVDLAASDDPLGPVDGRADGAGDPADQGEVA